MASEDIAAMSNDSESVAIATMPSQSGRLVILAFGVPSLVIWGLVMMYAIPLLLHIVMHLPSGMGSTNSGRALYAVLVGIFALAGAAVSVRILSRAWKGKAPVWSAAIALSISMLGFFLVGFIGD